MINYYETLGIEPSATAEEVKGAYRQLAKRHHPDVVGGDPVLFARVTEAYEVLSDAERRKVFDQVFRAAQEREEEPRPAQPRRGPRPAPLGDPGPPYTRLMSLELSPRGRFLVEGLAGRFSIRPTLAEELWETTLRKFGERDREGLARKVIQIRVNGPREVVRRMRPVPTEFGVQFQGNGTAIFGEEALREAFGEGSASDFLGARQINLADLVDANVTVEITVPVGVPVYLYDLSGDIVLGDLKGELVATLDGNTILRSGRLTAANLTLNGRAMAHIANLAGGADVIVLSEGKLLLGGAITRLRAVVENQGHLEVVGTVEMLQATVSGRGYLNAKGAVETAHCDVRAGGYVRLANVRKELSGSRSGGGQVDVLVPPPRDGVPPVAFRRTAAPRHP